MDLAKKSRALDMNAEYLGVDALMLMENAGREVAEHAKGFERIAVFSGLGNNGGDGFVAARHLASPGRIVHVYTFKGSRSYASQKNLDIIASMDSVELTYISDSSDCGGIELSGYDAIIDSLLGVGAKGDLREPVRSIVSLMNSAEACRIAVDCPTPGLEADLVVSFHFAKSKDAKVVPIGIPPEAESLCGPGDVFLALPGRGGREHKGDFGRVVVVGGSREFTGTTYLVAKAALRTGSDLATVATPRYAADHMPSCPDLIVRPLDSEYHLEKRDVKEILSLDFDSLIVGNGLGLHEDSGHALKKLLEGLTCPIVLDADALKLIKAKKLGENHIITPHRREFELLFDCEPSPENVMDSAGKTGATIVLKGEVDVVSNGIETRFNKTGNPGMTVGGTGDVLAGVIGALAAKAKPFEASCAGVFLAGLAGDLALDRFGFGLLASDCVELLPEAIRSCGVVR